MTKVILQFPDKLDDMVTPHINKLARAFGISTQYEWGEQKPDRKMFTNGGARSGRTVVGRPKGDISRVLLPLFLKSQHSINSLNDMLSKLTSSLPEGYNRGNLSSWLYRTVAHKKLIKKGDKYAITELGKKWVVDNE